MTPPYDILHRELDLLQTGMHKLYIPVVLFGYLLGTAAASATARLILGIGPFYSTGVGGSGL